jgi:hypothetical protein
MLTLSDFQKLPKEAQFNYTWGNCRYLATREEFPLTIKLYHSGAFFIEIEYFSYNGRIRLLKTFYTAEYLSAYVSNVDVQSLLMQPIHSSSRHHRRVPLIGNLPYWFWGGVIIKTMAIIAMVRLWLKVVFS